MRDSITNKQRQSVGSDTSPQGLLRPSWVEVSRSAFRHNIGLVRDQLPAGTGLICMIKADAYGHGATQLGKWLDEAKQDNTSFGVATLEEGIELRQAGVVAPIIVMGGLMGQGQRAAQESVLHNLTCVIHSVDALQLLGEVAKKPIKFHLKIDSGMTRLGARPENLAKILEKVSEFPQLQLAGVMTHLASSDDDAATEAQMKIFCENAQIVRAAVEGPIIWHVGNSGAIMRQGLSHSSSSDSKKINWCTPFPLQSGDSFSVRPGIMLYGISPFPILENKLPLLAALTIKSQIVLTKRVPSGTKVSYSGTWTAKRDSRIAILPIGYADGVAWSLANKGIVLLHGKRVPIVGRVTMDMIMIDVTDHPETLVGDEAVLLGQQQNEVINAEEVAGLAGTIPYEVVCRISRRMPRTYLD